MYSQRIRIAMVDSLQPDHVGLFEACSLFKIQDASVNAQVISSRPNERMRAKALYIVKSGNLI